MNDKLMLDFMNFMLDEILNYWNVSPASLTGAKRVAEWQDLKGRVAFSIQQKED